VKFQEVVHSVAAEEAKYLRFMISFDSKTQLGMQVPERLCKKRKSFSVSD
jgi:hypothetical protein